MRMWPLALLIVGATITAALDDEDPSYHANIRPILAKKCAPCHQRGGPAPFPLTTFAEVKPRATLLRWVAIVGTMPPTDAEGDLGEMSVCPPLADEELLAIQQWVKSGAKEGKPAPEPLVPSAAWRLSLPTKLLKPDRPGMVQIEGPPYRKLFVIDPKFEDRKAIAGFDLRPATPFALRHAYVAIVPEGKEPGSIFSAAGIEAKHLIGAWAPGYAAWRSSAGIPLRPGDRLAVWALFQPTGKAEDAGFEIGLDLKGGGPDVPKWTSLGNREFAIPPSDGLQTLRAESTLDEASDLLSIVPECRLYAQQVRVSAKLPTGESKRILTVKTWDRNWVGAYQPLVPIRLPKGTRITAEIDYDNTGHSQGNREARPTTSIRHGLDDSSELFWVHFQTVSHVP